MRLPMFRVRTMLAAVAVVALVLGVIAWARRVPPEERARWALLDRGTICLSDRANSDVPVHRVISDHATDDLLSVLPALPELREVCLNRSPISDAGLVHLRQVEGLEELYLWATPISDAGLAHLEAVTGLRRLELRRCAVNDAGLAHVAKIPNLERLNLEGTRITDAGLEHLRG